MDDILWNLPKLLAVVCSLSWATLSIYAVIWMKGATWEKTPKPKGLNDD